MAVMFAYGRNEYIGFKLVERIEAAAPRHR
jgi:hypothetical protein